MEVRKTAEDSRLTVAITGRIDTQTAPELERSLQESVDGATELILDFTDVTYISSAGLRTVITAQNWMDKKNGSMVVRNAGKNILNVFKVTGFDTFLTIE